jgi:hypothetical protein
MAQGGMNSETETEKFRADSRAYLRSGLMSLVASQAVLLQSAGIQKLFQ